MVRPTSPHPTPGELEILRIVWKSGPCSVRQVLETLNREHKPKRAYTTIMGLMVVMAEKGLLRRKRRGKAFIYEAREERGATLLDMACDLVDRAFGGSISSLLAHFVDSGQASAEELKAIQEVIAEHQQKSRRP